MTKAGQAQQTRENLISAARELFGKYGYVDTNTTEIALRAGTTRGALYHHFRDKLTLFKVVLSEVRAELGQKVRDRVQQAEGDAWQRFVVAGFSGFLDFVEDPNARRVLYLDGPGVMGRALSPEDEGPGMMVIREAMKVLVDEGYIEEQPLEPLCRLVWGVFFEAGIYIARADNNEVAQQEISFLVERLLGGLRVKAQSQQPYEKDKWLKRRQ